MRFEIEHDSSDGTWRVRDNDQPNEYIASCTSSERAERVRDALEKERDPGEVKVHSHVEDELPDGHPLQWQQVQCVACGVLVHAGNNECMQTWFEFSNANVCAPCVGTLPSVMHSNEWPDGGFGERNY
jgi:hypothetical protein